MHAYERILELLDNNSFHEIGNDINRKIGVDKSTHEITNYDGVITGYGKIYGKRVFIFSQDFTVLGGTVGVLHAAKIEHLYEQAIKHKCPIIGVNDSGGARIQEGVESLSGYARIFRQNVRASGLIPQISVILGPCAGGASYSPALTDFVFVVEKISQMFLTGPTVVKSVTSEEISIEELGGTHIHAKKSGVAHFCYKDEKRCLKSIRELIGYLPSSAYEKSTLNISNKYVPKASTKIADILPDESCRTYDVHGVIEEIIDSNSFIEVHKKFAKNIVVGFGKIVGTTIGIVANNSMHLAGTLDCDASDKASRFVRFCDAFSIPIITLVDVTGFYPGKEEERKGVIRHGAKLLYAYAEATTPKITINLRKSYGGAYIAMGCKVLGSDCSFAWEKAEIAVMGPEVAVNILYKKKIESLSGQARKDYIDTITSKYKKEVVNITNGAKNGHVDGVIAPESTREQIYSCLCLLKKKKQRPTIIKKHGNIPL